MNQEQIYNYCLDKSSYYQSVAELVMKFDRKKVYKVCYGYLTYTKDFKSEFHYNTIVGEIISWSRESVRFKVLAADLGVSQWGKVHELSMNHDRKKWEDRKDTVTVKYLMLLEKGSSLEEVPAGELPMYVGSKFIHEDFRKHLEAA